MTLNKKEIDRIITTCFESEEMREHLIEHRAELSNCEIIDIIKGAPIPLAAKAGLMRNVDETSYQDIKAALDALKLRDDQFFLYSLCGYERVDGKLEIDEDCIGPFRDLERVRESLREELFDAPEGESLWEHRLETEWWAELELFEPDGGGGFRNPYRYYLIADQICYFEKNDRKAYSGLFYLPSDWSYSRHTVDLNIDIPFRPGDIVTVDCRPFAGTKHLLLLEVGLDCCGVQALYWSDENKKWDTGAVKHGSIYDESHPILSPLYRMRRHTGELTGEEQHLMEVSRQIAGDAEAGRKIWLEINGYGEERNG